MNYVVKFHVKTIYQSYPKNLSKWCKIFLTAVYNKLLTFIIIFYTNKEKRKKKKLTWWSLFGVPWIMFILKHT